ncbi:iron-siderophore ABC transporter substrate-binding protein [Glaciimonas sp. CA11.2]|uniref:ABC transporter substrate-binding protein n=1 Tax=Glaciimonas sp. CA11.2 TaxID=3048601 RepID=UPI002AB35936|nr:iron-siderophore ABC transporter substrate-binding protein [Glaciimonas sp. CA11.2]MDY7547448.1 iron-siderophore ABC transporter substrate-binding protein [Glaciimonas sp. CA11.2]MEB0162777.1 iron-siderophore ABC transporter substrate-binding protein [Glaciimonas sp. CA11.2]
MQFFQKMMLAICCFLILTATQAMASDEIGIRSAVLPDHPKRIVVLEFLFAESLAALDLTPVGMVDPDRYREWIGYDNARFSNVIDIGTRQQPSLEAIARLKPDLIVGVTFRHAALFDAFERIAPTVLFNFNATDIKVNQLDHALKVFDVFAKLAGRSAAGKKVEQNLEISLAADRARLTAAGLSGKRLAVLQELGLQDMYWAYATNSMAGGIAQVLGLSLWPNWPTKEGTTFVSSEDLLKQKELHVLMISATGPEVGLAQKLHSPIWRYVPARIAGHVALVPRNIWGFGGPMSAAKLSRQLTDAMLAAGRGDGALNR